MAKRKIEALLVEDHSDKSKVFESYFDSFFEIDCQLTIVQSLTSAIEVLGRERFCLIFVSDTFSCENALPKIKYHFQPYYAPPIIVIARGNNCRAALQSMHENADDCLLDSELSSFAIEKTIINTLQHRQAHHQLLQSESRFRRMFEYASIGIFKSTFHGQFVSVNNAFLEMFGFSSADDLLASVHDIGSQLYVNSEVRPKIIEEFGKDSNGFYYEEVDFYKKDQSIFTGLLYIRRIDEMHHDDFMVEGYVQDITEKKHADAQIKTNLQFLRDVMDNIPGPVFSKDINLRFTGCNKEYEKYIALPESAILGKTLPEIQAGEMSDFLHHKDEQLIKDGQKNIFEHPVELVGGQQRHLLIHSNVIRNQNNEVIGLIGLMFDITDKKEVMEKLHEELLLNKAMADLSKELLKPGKSLAEISEIVLDFTKDITQSKNGYAGTIDQENGDLHIHNFDEMILGGCKVENKNLRLSKKNGRYPGLWGHCLNTLQAFYTNAPNEHPQSEGLPHGHFSINNFLTVPAIIDGLLIGQLSLANSAKPYADNDLESVAKLSNLYSIAVQKQRSVDLLLYAKEKAELSDKLKSAFLSNMSHEIRTPLNAIVGFAQMLGEEGIGEDETREFKGVIIKNTDLLLRLINDIIEMSMIEAGELKIHFENRRIKDLLFHIFHTWESRDEVIESIENIRFEMEYPEHDSGAIVKIDALRFTQAIDNLLMNAFRFTRQGKIVLGYRFNEAGEVEVYVSDSGIGISEKDQETIFERFRQVDELKVRPYSGTGLGLAITKKLVEHLSGKIALRSEAEKGSQFTITLPVHERTTSTKGSAAIEARKRMADHGEHIKGKNILIVEDNDSSYEFLEILLRRKEAKSSRAKDGLEAVEKATTESYDLILMDLQLPKMSGFDAIRQIRNTNKQVPIIVQTAFSEDSERERAYAAGCDDYLIKPLTKTQIEKTIARYLE